MWKRFDIRKELWILQHERPSQTHSKPRTFSCAGKILPAVCVGGRVPPVVTLFCGSSVSRGALGGHKDSVAFAKPSTVKWASPIPQLVKNPPSMHEPPIRFLSWEDLLEKG